jgi:hypothetical protein
MIRYSLFDIRYSKSKKFSCFRLLAAVVGWPTFSVCFRPQSSALSPQTYLFEPEPATENLTPESRCAIIIL